MLIAAFDTETIPSQALPGFCYDDFASGIKTGNAGPEKAKEKIEAKMNVTPRTCQVCAFVGYIYDTTTGKAIEKVVSIMKDAAPSAEEEYQLTHDAWEFIKKATTSKMPLVTYNGISYDLPVLRMAALRHDILFSGIEYKKLTGKWNATKFHYDLMLCLGDFDKQASYVKLDFWLHYFGIGTKAEGMDGSQVYPAWKAKEFQKIQDYCEDDVKNLCTLFQRVETYIRVE